jgi:hypothetical protein
MSCPVLIDPSCVVIGKVSGAVAGTAASDALSGIADAIQSGVAWIVANSIDWWVQVPSPDLATQSAVGRLQQWILPLAVAVAVLGLIIAGGKMALTRKANPLIDAGGGLVIIAATSAIGVLLPTLLLRAGDAWSTWVLNTSTGGQFASRLTNLLTLGGAASAVVIVLGIVGIIISAIQAVLMLFRQAALIILAGTLPLAAAGTLTSATRAWFKRVTGWMLALIFYKPAAAAIYATAFILIGSSKGLRAILMGFAMVFVSLLALPVLMRLFTWTTGQVADSTAGGGFLQTALSGAIAIGALRGSSGGSGGSSAAEQARLVSAQLGPAGAGPRGAPTPGTGTYQSPAPSPGPRVSGTAGMPAGAWPSSAGARAGAVPGAGAGVAPGAAASGAAAGSGAGAAGTSAAAAGGPAGMAGSGLAAGARGANRKATEALQPPDSAGGGQ